MTAVVDDSAELLSSCRFFAGCLVASNRFDDLETKTPVAIFGSPYQMYPSIEHVRWPLFGGSGIAVPHLGQYRGAIDSIRFCSCRTTSSFEAEKSFVIRSTNFCSNLIETIERLKEF